VHSPATASAISCLCVGARQGRAHLQCSALRAPSAPLVDSRPCSAAEVGTAPGRQNPFLHLLVFLLTNSTVSAETELCLLLAVCGLLASCACVRSTSGWRAAPSSVPLLSQLILLSESMVFASVNDKSYH
jgi:hypothetical protein